MTNEELEAWAQTHYEIAAAIEQKSEDEKSEIRERQENYGMFAKHELAFELTVKFQEIHKDTEWDGEYIDVLDEFIKEHVK